VKWHTIGILALRTRHVTPTEILEAAGFNLTKKVFVDGGEAASTYYQAETDAEDRTLRLKFRESFHLQKEKAEHGGGYR
jgi:hypothetical protein